MNIVLINHTHPDTAHVSALRMREFANCLASAGDRAVLITGPLKPSDGGETLAELGARMAAHEWTLPFHIACRLSETPLRRAAREGRMLAPFRQVVIGASYISKGGMFGDWRTGVSNIFPLITRQFSPDIIFATFGNTDAWSIARDLARAAQCPWIADYKDPWDCFIPIGLRRRIAARYADMSGMTVFSHTHAHDAAAWFPCAKEVVYSGYLSDPTNKLPEAENGNLRVMLSGSIYDGSSIWLLIKALALVSKKANVVLNYAGNDGSRVREMINRANSGVTFKDFGYLSIDALTRLQRSASVNVYARNRNSLFQQKLIELIAVGRPVLAVPDEGEEAKNLVEAVGGTLIPARNPAEIASGLARLRTEEVSIDLERLRIFSWSTQTEKLKRFFSSVL
ncbi:MAG: glycosyltransferase [Pseudomonadota bacterium]|nr:glycosyltransferase [Pseudomonadota bacterium]